MILLMRGLTVDVKKILMMKGPTVDVTVDAVIWLLMFGMDLDS